MSDVPGGSGPWGNPQQWSEPAPGGSGGHAPSPPEPPSTILTAVKLMYVGAALSALGILIMFIQMDEIRDAVEEDNPRLTESELDAAVNIGIAVGVIVGLIGVGLWIWMAVMNRQGQSWARVVAAVLGGLNIGMTTLGLVAGEAMGQPETGLGLALSIANVGLAAIILILLFQKDSSDYYDQVSRHRLGGGWGYG